MVAQHAAIKEARRLGMTEQKLREQVRAIVFKAYLNGRTDTVAVSPGGVAEGSNSMHAVPTIDFLVGDLMKLFAKYYRGQVVDLGKINIEELPF